MNDNMTPFGAMLFEAFAPTFVKQQIPDMERAALDGLRAERAADEARVEQAIRAIREARP